MYETEKLLNEYLLFHYGTDDELFPWTQGPREALRFAERTVSYFDRKPVSRALDVGCAVGRSSFELAGQACEVIGLDYSQRFIEAARMLQAGKSLSCERLEEGNLVSRVEVSAPLGMASERVSFEQGDAMALREDLGSFDRVHAANLLCRLPEPGRFLSRLPGLVRPGGELVLATPCTWLEEFTPRENWPVGRTFDWLRECLEGDFDLEGEGNEALLIRETARKFQWTVSLVTKWRRRFPAEG